MRNTFNSMANEIANLKNANSHLGEYIKCFEKGRDLLKKEKQATCIEDFLDQS